MPSGGHAASGRLPDPNALRNERGGVAHWTTLPQRSDAPAPEWPLSAASEAEAVMWTETWAMPQATMWGKQVREVALYVRTFLRAGSTDDNAARYLAAARQQADSLGLTQPGLARLRWRIATEPAAAPEVKRPNGSRRTAAPSRFETIIGGKSA